MTASGREPVREWLKALRLEDSDVIEQDIKTAQYGWLVGMPAVRKLEPGLWDIRSHLDHGIARVLFAVDGELMAMLHAFVKKSRPTPAHELRTARGRRARIRRGATT
jgi:phage-related protein